MATKRIKARPFNGGANRPVAGKGKFRPVKDVGPDARRHVFTPEERLRGGMRTWELYIRVSWGYDWRKRAHQAKKIDGVGAGAFP